MSVFSPRDLLQELDRLERLRQPAPGVENLRQFERFVVRGEAELHPISRNRLDRSPLEVQLRDASLGGVGFVSGQPLRAGSVWRIVFLEHGYPVDEQFLQIRHASGIGDEIYLCGGQFCAGPSLLTALGIEPASVHRQLTPTPGQPGDFATPEDAG